MVFLTFHKFLNSKNIFFLRDQKSVEQLGKGVYVFPMIDVQ